MRLFFPLRSPFMFIVDRLGIFHMKPAPPENELPASTRKAVFGGFLAKRFLTLIVVLGVAAWGTDLVKANELSNGLLDTTSISSQVLATPTGWAVNATRPVSGPHNDAASSEAFANVEAPGGMGLFFKAFQGATDNPLTVDFFQDKPGTAGLLYSLTAYAGAEANYSGLIPGSVTRSVLALEFLNAGSSVIGGSVLDLKTAGLGSSGNPFGYAQYRVTAAAPAGTVNVRARASMIDGFNNPAGGGQAFVVDAFDLTIVPEPTTFILAGFGLIGLVGIRRRG
jgi:hypothetical protein